jgi:hypothetical protein
MNTFETFEKPFKIKEVGVTQYEVYNSNVLYATIRPKNPILSEPSVIDCKTVVDYYNNLTEQLQELRDAISEKRSDISDAIDDILQGKKFDGNIEHRTSVFKLPIDDMHCDGKYVTVEYDTLTTMMRYDQVGTEEPSEPIDAHEYYD